MTETNLDKPRRAKRRVALPAIIAGGLSSLLLAFSLTPTFSSLTAAITNSNNTGGVGLLTMTESDGTSTCYSNGTANGSTDTNSATCTTINKYGGATLVPATGSNTATKTVTVTNSGSVPASAFTLVPGDCSSSAVGTVSGTAADLCSQMTVKIEIGSGASPSTWTTINAQTLKALYNNGSGTIDVLNKLSVSSLPANGVVSFRFTVTLPTTVGNSYQGLQAKQALTFNFQA